MNKKYFIVNEKINSLSKNKIKSIEKTHSDALLNGYKRNRELTNKRLSDNINLKHTEGRIIIKIDIDAKDVHKFDNGIEIYIGRRFNNLNRRHTEPVNAWVADAEYIKEGCEILIHPNSICDANKIFNYDNVSVEENNALRYYSIEEISAFLYREGVDWKPLKGFATGLRVFKSYNGLIANIPHEKIENVLYITSGEYKGQIVQTLRACDYEIIFTGINGREERIIRCRHYEGYDHDREEIIIERHDLTELVNKGELLVGLSPSDAKFIN